jgi:hypothetical protein
MPAAARNSITLEGRIITGTQPELVIKMISTQKLACVCLVYKYSEVVLGAIRVYHLTAAKGEIWQFRNNFLL